MSSSSPASVGRIPALILSAIAGTVLAWASAFVVIRAVVPHFSPGALTLGRLLIGSVILGAVLLLRRAWVRPSGRDWLLLIGCGVAWFAVYNIALNAAELELDAGTTAMLVNVGPILIAVLADTLLREGIPPWLIGGAVVSLVGVVLISIGSSGVAIGSGWGVALCLIAAISYAIGVILQKVVLRRLPALQVTWIACTVGAVVCLPFVRQLIDEVQRAPSSSTWGVVYLGAVPTALAFTTWAYALSRMPAGRLGVTTYIVPPLTILIAWWFLGEVPAPLQVVGGVVCLIGVALSRITSRRKTAVPS
ncbi:DMT family transporter [Leifsonia sp. Leaf264]|uniref:DMT family transporter n=1 Tax=Leifsonia sp. Leaf264 TaxID=1736314 RepID=UPI0006FA2F41|nr:DMT family transporter [Leifsonia sp. Leaf264]KQP01309.1 multidrug transporter [Leifsonia sp. Leaf264]